MATYISLLRGINVSGQKPVKMEALRNMFENMGFHKVRTYLQSGNVVFEGDTSEIKNMEQSISQQIESEFGFIVPVMVLTVDKLEQIIGSNPFLSDPAKDHAYLHLTFLSSHPAPYNKEFIESKKQNGEEISFTQNAIYLYCPNGYGRTKLTNNFLESRLKIMATTRNWKTVNELFNLAKQTL